MSVTEGLKKGRKAQEKAQETVKGAVSGTLSGAVHEPMSRLNKEMRNLASAAGQRLLTSAAGKVEGLAGRLTGYVENEGSGLLSAVTGRSGDGPSPAVAGMMTFAKEKIKQKLKAALPGKGGGKPKKLRFTTIVESIDVGAPLRVVYDQWTQFQDFPGFMKKVETVEQKADEKLDWKAQVFWSHRTWESKILEQVPDKRIIWRSKGAKGYVDGAVTFHELAPELTRVLLVLEYHPQGMFERTGNIWRAQGRRARLELKHFRRHVMTQDLLHPDEVKGWRGEIHEGRVVKDQEAALKEERAEEAEEPTGEAGEPVEEAAAEPTAEPTAERPEERTPTEEARLREHRPPVQRRPTEEEGPVHAAPRRMSLRTHGRHRG
ncbi:SRPBCC family protein [Microtetraspora glauca]|uniref:SRPBCC family protein n=1 Tax=Microtetraspora glauca TaxID=1996 RepID=A0ABV3GNB5_MICGL